MRNKHSHKKKKISVEQAKTIVSKLSQEEKDQIINLKLGQMLHNLASQIAHLQNTLDMKLSFKLAYPISSEDTRTMFIELSPHENTPKVMEEQSSEESKQLE